MEANPLAKLNDIIITPLQGYWPLSLIATLMIGALLAGTAALVFWGVKTWQHQAAVRAAQSELHSLPTRIEISALNSLVKRCALAYYPRDEIASLSGNKWDLWLSNYQTQEQQQLWQQLSERQYSPNSVVNKEEYLPLVQQTLSRLGKRKAAC